MANGKSVKVYLDRIISDIDAGRKPTRQTAGWVRSLAVPVAVGLSMGIAGCDTEEEAADFRSEVTAEDMMNVRDGKADDYTLDWMCGLVQLPTGCSIDEICEAAGFHDDGICDTTCPSDPDCADIVLMYGVPFEGACGDFWDNDGDGLVDCDDPDCAADINCNMVLMYGVPMPFESDCNDSLDNDGDGLVDCEDSDCWDACLVMPAYAVPMPEEADCDDGVDNDYDGWTDCFDPDCASVLHCTDVVMMYGFPIESACEDGLDNDGDGRVDCDDTDCRGFPVCEVTARYMAPFEANCDDDVDNDGDGRVDCDDTDCSINPQCSGATARYMAPFEANCEDEADNDEDGLVDCADPDCAC